MAESGEVQISRRGRRPALEVRWDRLAKKSLWRDRRAPPEGEPAGAAAAGVEEEEGAAAEGEEDWGGAGAEAGGGGGEGIGAEGGEEEGVAAAAK